jgi:hypothetical protein
MFLSNTGEADEVGAETESSTLASRYTDGRGDQVQDRKHGSRNEGERGDLVNRERLAGDEDRSTSHYEALNQILDSAINNFGDVHLILYSDIRKFIAVRIFYLKSLYYTL